MHNLIRVLYIASVVLAQTVNEATPGEVVPTTSPAPTPTSSPTLTYSTFVETIFSSIEGLTKLVEVKDIESVVKTTRSDSVVSTDIFVKTERSDSVATMFNYSNDTLVIPEVHKFF
ncbi:hypothetical protein BC833DRAFT_575794 [Globomyces pollinis-pini]|nr:hypothetical protein BC833DRAFT_575794 [Globomyces pollinis-pini]